MSLHIPLPAITDHLSKRIGHTPNPTPQTRQLHYLAVIHKQIHINTKLPNIPVEDLGISSLKHDPLHREFLEDGLDDIRAPFIDVLRDPLALDHEPLHPRVEEFLAETHDLEWIAFPHGFEFLGGSVAAGTELNPELGLCGQPVAVDLFDEAQPVVWWEREETG